MAETVCRQSKCELVLMDVCTENDESGLVAAEKIKKNKIHVAVFCSPHTVSYTHLDVYKRQSAIAVRRISISLSIVL